MTISRRLSRGVSGICALLLVGTLIAWTRTGATLEGLSYTWGSSSLATGIPDQPGPSWDYRTRTLRLWHYDGTIGFSFAVFTSFGNTNEDLQRWRAHDGWAFERLVIDPQHLIREPDFWDGPFAFRLGGMSIGQVGRQGVDCRVVIVPQSLLAVLFAGPILLQTGVWGRRRRRVAGGRCSKCGYDLKGLRLQKCPECGHLRA
jgi:hypothetical protein